MKNTTDHYFSRFACMAAELIERKPDGAQPPPPTEVLLRALDTLSHWYSRQPASREAALKAAELLQTLVLRYDQFWDSFFSVAQAGDPFHEAAKAAVESGKMPTTIEEVDALLRNL